MNDLSAHIEALIFAAEQPMSIKEIQDCLERVHGKEIDKNDVEAGIDALIKKYGEGDFAFEITGLAGGFQFMTKPAYQATVSAWLKSKLNRRLSTNALETLSIIAYRQPVTKGAIEKIRGVNCDYTIQKLLEKELISIVGRGEEIGRPLLYGTSQFFMNYFGIQSVSDLPKLSELEQPNENTIGDPSEN